MIDGGPGAEPLGRLDAWLVTDESAELMAAVRRLAAAKGLRPRAGDVQKNGLRIERRSVVHTSHRTYAYRIRVQGHTDDHRVLDGSAVGRELPFRRPHAEPVAEAVDEDVSGGAHEQDGRHVLP